MPDRTLGISATLILALVVAASVSGAERQMNVRQGPETVFDRPVEEILPELSGATATGENGRVGSELVFWGYELADRSPVYFFACALLVGGDHCEARTAAICPAGKITNVLRTGEYVGTVVRRRCRDACVVTPGDVHACCTNLTERTELAIGLAHCD
jgi:hypothetical protein